MKSGPVEGNLAERYFRIVVTLDVQFHSPAVGFHKDTETFSRGNILGNSYDLKISHALLYHLQRTDRIGIGSTVIFPEQLQFDGISVRNGFRQRDIKVSNIRAPVKNIVFKNRSSVHAQLPQRPAAGGEIDAHPVVHVVVSLCILAKGNTAYGLPVLIKAGGLQPAFTLEEGTAYTDQYAGQIIRNLEGVFYLSVFFKVSGRNSYIDYRIRPVIDIIDITALLLVIQFKFHPKVTVRSRLQSMLSDHRKHGFHLSRSETVTGNPVIGMTLKIVVVSLEVKGILFLCNDGRVEVVINIKL